MRPYRVYHPASSVYPSTSLSLSTSLGMKNGRLIHRFDLGHLVNLYGISIRKQTVMFNACYMNIIKRIFPNKIMFNIGANSNITELLPMIR